MFAVEEEQIMGLRYMMNIMFSVASKKNHLD